MRIIISIFTNIMVELLSIVVINMYLGFFLEKKGDRIKKIIIPIALIIATFSHNVVFMSRIFILIRLVIIILMVSMYGGDIKRKMLVSIVLTAISLFFDTIVHGIFRGGRNLYGRENIMSIISTLLLLFCGYLFMQTVQEYKKDNNRKPMEILIIPGISAISLPLLYGNKNIGTEAIVYISIILILVNLLVYYLYELLTEIYNKNLTNIKINEQLKIYESQLRIRQESEKKILLFRHDINNHINEISQLNKDKRYEELTDYLNEIKKNIYYEEDYVNTGNYAVDGVLNYKIREAIANKIEVNTEIKIPCDLKLNAFDMNCLLGNIMDNAIEGTKEVTKPYINILMKFVSGCILINIINPYNHKLEKNGDTYKTTKHDKEEHGYGISNIKKIMDKYNGMLLISDENNLFSVKIRIFTDIKQN